MGYPFSNNKVASANLVENGMEMFNAFDGTWNDTLRSLTLAITWPQRVWLPPAKWHYLISGGSSGE
jgi:hypothetical protein